MSDTLDAVRRFASFPSIVLFTLYPVLPVMAQFSNISIMLSWVSNNCGSQSMRAVQLGILNALGQTFSILAAFSFPAEEGPRWYRGFGLNIAFNVLAAVLALGLSLWLKRENKRRDRVEGEYLNKEDTDDVDVVHKHDLASGFRYTP